MENDESGMQSLRKPDTAPEKRLRKPAGWEAHQNRFRRPQLPCYMGLSLVRLRPRVGVLRAPLPGELTQTLEGIHAKELAKPPTDLVPSPDLAAAQLFSARLRATGR